eukprot:CAMPEP_0185747212 /NCGR_PEP_ID=MMETSP1174-20130828/5832_1 /TAXON_ID=35687 /ORGANISM="Dictyocha speculum, Strain CCMP1381" /LENGTH=68 /DNA_ID=CAMNT_0028422279 /DNA_START=55 /DNA_END=258 /DNA_ORIENTATION=-
MSTSVEKRKTDNFNLRILHTEVSEETRAFAIQVATNAYTALIKGEKAHMQELAEMVKKEFDAKYSGTW